MSLKDDDRTPHALQVHPAIVSNTACPPAEEQGEHERNRQEAAAVLKLGREDNSQLPPPADSACHSHGVLESSCKDARWDVRCCSGPRATPPPWPPPPEPRPLRFRSTAQSPPPLAAATAAAMAVEVPSALPRLPRSGDCRAAASPSVSEPPKDADTRAGHPVAASPSPAGGLRLRCGRRQAGQHRCGRRRRAQAKRAVTPAPSAAAAVHHADRQHRRGLWVLP